MKLTIPELRITDQNKHWSELPVKKRILKKPIKWCPNQWDKGALYKRNQEEGAAWRCIRCKRQWKDKKELEEEDR